MILLPPAVQDLDLPLCGTTTALTPASHTLDIVQTVLPRQPYKDLFYGILQLIVFIGFVQTIPDGSWIPLFPVCPQPDISIPLKPGEFAGRFLIPPAFYKTFEDSFALCGRVDNVGWGSVLLKPPFI